MPGVDFRPPREAGEPLNVFKILKGLFPTLTGRETPFKDALDWLQFTYNAGRVGAYMAPESAVIAQSAVAEGGKLFLYFMYNLRRLYPEVYGPECFLGWKPDHREFPLEEGGGIERQYLYN